MQQKSALETTGITLFLGALGAALAWLAGIPAPFLLGPTIVVTVAGLTGLKLAIADPVRDLCFIIIGIAMGSSATPQAVSMAASWPISFVMMIIIVLIVFAAAYLLLFYLFGYDRNTAILAAAPGFMSFIVGLGSEIKSDLVAISIIQSIRVLVLTLVVPLLVTVLHLQHPLSSVVAVPMSWLAVVVLLPLSFLAGLVFKKLRLPAAYLLGGAFVSTIAHLDVLAVGLVPWELSTPAYMAMGCLIGSRFSGVTFEMLKSAFWAGISTTLLVTGIAGSLAYATAHILNLPLNGVLIAYAPGGLEGMTAMAILMGADSTFVGAHHVLRLLFLTVLMPILMRNARKPEIAA